MSARPVRRSGRFRKPTPGEPLARGVFGRRLILRVLAWMLPAAVVWMLLTPFYNRFLTEATENLVRLTERPAVTLLTVTKTHYFLVHRTDVNPPQRGHLSSVRITDTHFPLVMLGAFFLAVPGVSWRRRLEALGWALLISVFFHLFSLLFWVKFIYATQLGTWSTEHYGTFGRNFWGLGKHLLDLPFKFGLPLLLWAAFFLRELLPRPSAASA